MMEKIRFTALAKVKSKSDPVENLAQSTPTHIGERYRGLFSEKGMGEVQRLPRERISLLKAPAGSAGGGGVRFGLALHVGQVLYGNIGGGNRLDFTCIGPAVNLAARLEKLTGKFALPITEA